jgi:NitT/TauT family transport system permease protein
VLLPVIGLLVLHFWTQIAESGEYPAFMLPHPEAVQARFIELWQDGSLIEHSAVTLWEAMAGLFLASIFAMTLGYFIARLSFLDYLLTPYLIFFQAVPIIAISPLIVIWFGSGITSKIVITALITWFPLMIATIIGLRSVSPRLRELMRANAANPWQMFWHLEVPSALPEVLGGFKIAVTLSVIGAVVGEFFGASEGLGYLVRAGRTTADTPLVICAILVLTGLSLLLYGLVSWLEYALLAWRRAGNQA